MKLKTRLVKIFLALFLILGGLVVYISEKTALAAPPFTSTDPRKLTIYGGVLTIVNGTSTNTHALEIGTAPDNNGLALTTTGRLYITPSSSTANSYFSGSGNTQNLKLSGYLEVGSTTGWPQLRITNPSNKQVNIGFAADDWFDFKREDNIGYFVFRKQTSITPPVAENIMTIDVPRNRVYVNNEDNGDYAKLTVNNPKTPGKHGSSTDTIYAYANSTDPLNPGAAISAEQAGVGYAGYFSGKLSASQYCISGANCISAWPTISLSGSGTANYLTKWTAGNTLGNSVVYETAGKIGIGVAAANAKLTVTDGTAIGAASTNTLSLYNNSADSALYAQQNNTTGYAGYFSGTVHVQGYLQVTAGAPDIGRVLTAVDTSGNANWQTTRVRTPGFSCPTEQAGSSIVQYVTCTLGNKYGETTTRIDTFTGPQVVIHWSGNGSDTLFDLKGDEDATANRYCVELGYTGFYSKTTKAPDWAYSARWLGKYWEVYTGALTIVNQITCY